MSRVAEEDKKKSADVWSFMHKAKSGDKFVYHTGMPFSLGKIVARDVNAIVDRGQAVCFQKRRTDIPSRKPRQRDGEPTPEGLIHTYDYIIQKI